MPQVRGKTIYVLGAGASVHAGPPLLRDFLLRSQELYWAKKPKSSVHGIRYPDAFDRLFKWLGEANLGLEVLDADNLEDVFSIIELGNEAGVDGFHDLRKAVSDVMFDTLALTTEFVVNADKGYHDPLYIKLGAHLRGCEKVRKSRIASDRYQRDSIITFNYDLLLDVSFAEDRIGLNYGLGDGSADAFDVFKLHGSMNWLHHPSCDQPSDDRISVIPPHQLQQWFFPVSEGRYRLNHMQLMVNNGRCRVCNVSTSDTSPSFVPPTWSKSPLRGNLSKVWAAAIKSLHDAEQIVVIGYSLPETDTFFKYMLTLGLSDAKQLRRVIVVNPDGSGETERKYKAVFTRKKIRVEYMRESFSTFLNRDSVSRVLEYQ